jgi:UDP-N-acetylmuramoyl-L-alanyl-D-glutamate--2,6-diaminopimelate ligase
MLRSLKGLYHLLVAILANVWFGFPSRKLTVIGVTGTDGKTTTTSLIYEILKSAGMKASMITSVHAVIAGKSYDTGFHVTTPSAFFVQKYLAAAARAGETHMALEVTSHGLAQHRVFGIKFAAGVLTNVTHEHLDWHGNMESYRDAKIKLLKKSRVAILNRDEAELYRIAKERIVGKRIVTYGIHRTARVTPETYPFTTPLIGEFNRYNCLAAIATAVALDIDIKAAKKAIAQFGGVAGRMQTVIEKPFRVIVDFAHTPNAIDRALRASSELPHKRLIHVFGSAGLRDRTKRPLMGEASSRWANDIILTEEDYRTENVGEIIDAIAAGITAGPTVVKMPDRASAIAYALRIARSGDIVMVTGKGHEKSLCRGKVEYPWSDIETVKTAFADVSKAHATKS